MNMKLIIGLGNPGEKYSKTRHNTGFLALNYFIENSGVGISASKSWAHSETKELSGDFGKALAVYPETFMNLSGDAVRELVDFYKLSPSEIIVLHDDVDLPLGTFRLTPSSGAAGHNGVQSVIDSLGTSEFRRIRIGIESRQGRNEMPTDAFVLQNFAEGQIEKIPFKEISAEISKFLAE